MIVCSCNRVSERQFREAIANAPRPLTDAAKVYRAAGCQPKCGRCADTIRAIMTETPNNCSTCVTVAAAKGLDAA